MSVVGIFMFGTGVFGIGLVSAFIGLMASDTPKEAPPILASRNTNT